MKSIHLGLLTTTLLAGCASVPPFPEPDSSWKTFSGQLQVVSPERSLIGEFVASRKGNDFRLEFSKGGSVPLIRVSRHEQFARAEGPLARGQWQGVANAAPAPLQGWLVEVPRAFTGVQPMMQAAQRAIAGTSGPSGKMPSRLEINGAQPGERFVFVFAR